MHVLRGMRQLAGSAGLAALMIGAIPNLAEARPGVTTKAREPFRLMARAVSAMNVNRVNYGITSKGEIGPDEFGRGNLGGGFWPRGTENEYMYNSGIQVSGIIEGEKSATNPWGGDTSSAKFFDPIGSQQHAEQAWPAPGDRGVFRSWDPVDVPEWPEVALVPEGDVTEDMFHPLLRGQMAASQGDAYMISWDGSPNFITGRPHPLGIVIEHRVMAWNYPVGNEDVIYYVATAYNITSTNPERYEGVRPALREILLQKAAEFQELNNAHFGITLPTDGYAIDPFYMAWAADPDVGTGGNWSSVNLPFALGYMYQANFMRPAGWVFPPDIFGPPFFAGPGIFGAKYLRSPLGPGEINLFSTTINGGDPSPASSLFRWMNGNPAGGCTVNDPATNHICQIDQGNASGNPRDLRMFQSAPGARLEPGNSSSVVVAYIHAAPVALDGYTPCSTCYAEQNHRPAGRVLNIARADSMRVRNGGVHRVDSLTGFRRYTGPYFDYFVNDTGVPDSVGHLPTQYEFEVVPGSLLSKALVAQQIFDNRFLLPFAPENPEFFLIPGDRQVTVLWKPSSTETAGDAFYAVSSPYRNADGSLNGLYNPNFRQFDVEGYRIYRGRSDNPAALQLLAQFDYAGTSIKDHGGVIMTSLNECAPEIGRMVGCAQAWPGVIGDVEATVSETFDLSGQLIQVPKIGSRFLREDINALVYTSADTLMTGAYYIQMRSASGGVGYPTLSNTGVPWVFEDKAGNCALCGVTNGVNYFYTVTAFDVNSLVSGPASLESGRASKPVTVGSTSASFDNQGIGQPRVVGRSVRTDDLMPTLNPTTGRFNKAFPPSNSVSVKLAAFIPELLKGEGSIGIRLDSIGPATVVAAGTNATATYYMTVSPAGSESFRVAPVVTMLPTATTAATVQDSVSSTGPFTAMTFDPALAAVYGGVTDGYGVQATWTLRRQRAYYTASWGRGCANATSATAVAGFFWNITQKCYYNGPRWFSGSNETMDHPTGATPWVFDTINARPDGQRRFNNAGALDGVVTAHFPSSYGMIAGGSWWKTELVLGHYITAADYRVYWGDAGTIDSVIDLTHDLVIPFQTDMASSWGVLNPSSVPQAKRYSQRDILTVTDISCVWPLKNAPAINIHRTIGVNVDSFDFAAAGTGRGEVLGYPCQTPVAERPNRAMAIPLENRAVPGPIGFVTGSPHRAKDAAIVPRAANDGFMLYLKGRVYMFELAGGQVPAKGTAWTVRDYAGVISGGQGDAGDLGPYRFYPVGLPFTAVGATMEFHYKVNNDVVKPTAAMLAKIKTVPDPYYVTSAFDAGVTSKVIKFLNVPHGAKIRIYTISGILVTELRNDNEMARDGTVQWNVRNRSNQFVATGPYLWVVEADGVVQQGRMLIVNNASNFN